MKRVHCLLFLAAVTLTACSDSGTGSVMDSRSASPAHDARYETQMNKFDEQAARTDTQLTKAEKQGERMDALMLKWEEQAKRYDALLTKWEKQKQAGGK